MANDKKWKYLSELANMRIKWDQIIEEIQQAVIKKANL